MTVSKFLSPCLRLNSLLKGGAVLLLLFVAVMVFPGCGSQPENDIILNVEECADTLLEAIDFQDTLTALEEQMIAAIYRISAEDIIKQKVYVSTGATAEEIAVFEATDADAAQRVEAAVWDRVAGQKVGFEDYLPAELPKLEDPFLLVKGRYVIFCVSDHKETVKAELKKFF
jgi:hypothetical protein